MAHTPGPWTVEVRGTPSNKWWSVNTATMHGEISVNTGEDDACLISAATDLLAALKQAVSLLSYASQDGGIRGCNAAEWFAMEPSCRAAIAKAEGRSQ